MVFVQVQLGTIEIVSMVPSGTRITLQAPLGTVETTLWCHMVLEETLLGTTETISMVTYGD